MRSTHFMKDKLAVFEIRMLMRMTAKAAGRRVPPLQGLTRKACLKQYQLYTKTLLEGMDEGEQTALRGAMYDRAFAMGSLLGRLPGMRRDEGKMWLIRLLYRNIGIEIKGQMPGEIHVPRCAFSRYYTPGMCHVMSGMDAGIICGIFGGGILTFDRRLTEGCPACRAVYRR